MSTQRNKRTGRRFLQATRRKMQLGPQIAVRVTRRTPISITSLTIVGSTIVLVFDTDVSLKGIPQFESSNSLFPTAAAKTAVGEVTLTYPSAPTDPFDIPFEDPAIRNAAAGYVLAGSRAADE